jgi:hypothetical protein
MALSTIDQVSLSPNVAGNGPAFAATVSSQGFSSNTATKIQFSVKEFDTNNCFDNTTNYRFTPNVAGYYQVNFVLNLTGASYFSIGSALLYKNGSAIKQVNNNFNGGTGAMNYSANSFSNIVYMNGTTDYLEVYGYSNVTSPTVVNSTTASAGTTSFSAALIRSA